MRAMPASILMTSRRALPSVTWLTSMRPVAAALATAPVPDWLAAMPDRPLIYLTLGTLFNRDLRVFATVLDGLRDQPVSAVVTVGQNNDPSALGPQTANIAVHRYVPQAELLPHCHAAVIHGGAGTVLGALAAGVPLLCLPQGADQHFNADRVVAAGGALGGFGGHELDKARLLEAEGLVVVGRRIRRFNACRWR